MLFYSRGWILKKRKKKKMTFLENFDTQTCERVIKKKKKGRLVETRMVPRATAELIKLATVRKDDKGNFSITENRQFISFLQKPISSLSKCHLPVYFVLNSLQLNSPSSHLSLPQKLMLYLSL